MSIKRFVRSGIAGLVAMMMTDGAIGAAQAQSSTIFGATLGEPNQKTPEVSTEDIRRYLADGSAIVLDSRKRSEYVAGHIAGARNVAPNPEAPPADYVAAVERLVGGDKSKALVLYCNGRFCQASRRLSEQLVAAGFTNVRRYQLGIPIWRALGGPTEIELEGIMRVYRIDQTAVFFDARAAEDFSRASLPGTHNVPIDQIGAGALEKAPLPRDDFNTRVVLFGRDGAQARKLADALGKTPYQNVAYFPGTFDALAAAVRSKYGN
jgi:rhodanese-related sulfurtransferase